MNDELKIAIIRTGPTQRDVSIDAKIAEGRLSDLIRERARPTRQERNALRRILGRDYFEKASAPL